VPAINGFRIVFTSRKAIRPACWLGSVDFGAKELQRFDVDDFAAKRFKDLLDRGVLGSGLPGVLF
jgi:hypothetical protein